MQLRVMSFNIRYDAPSDVDRHGDNRWVVRRERVAESIRSVLPNIVGLQEVLHHQLEWLRKTLPEYAALGVGRDDGETGGEYAALLYHQDRMRVEESGVFWFSETPELVGSRGWGATLPRIATWARLVERESGRAVYVYNLHLDHQSVRAREESAQLLAARIRERPTPDPVVVTGDFNATEADFPMVFLRSATSPTPVDTYRHLHPDTGDAGTYHDFSGIPQGRIDYILTSPEWQVQDASILDAPLGGGYPSDHFPITATLLLAP